MRNTLAMRNRLGKTGEHDSRLGFRMAAKNRRGPGPPGPLRLLVPFLPDLAYG